MSEDEKIHAERLLEEFKGKDYAFGREALKKAGAQAARLGDEIVIIVGKQARKSSVLEAVSSSIDREGVRVTKVLDGASPNTPREDIYRLAYQLSTSKWRGVVAIGGGSCIDGSKAALTLATYGGLIDEYFGTGKISEESGGEQLPLMAVQTASSSSAHLTKYSNVTDVITQQKKLIVDQSIVPRTSVFQYDVTRTMPPGLTKDGGLDGIAHCWEVWMGSTGKDYYNKVSEIAYLGIKLIVNKLPHAVKNGKALEARYDLGLGTDLGGYSIMVGGTNGPHLGSFSLVDILSHGRACAILNPYYTILFSPNIQTQLKRVAEIYKEAGFIRKRVKNLAGRELADEVAKGMIKLSQSLDFPTTLKEAGATKNHVDRMINAAKDPQLKMKLQNMPIPMDAAAGDIDRLMKPTLKAAYTGDLSLIPNLRQE